MSCESDLRALPPQTLSDEAAFALVEALYAMAGALKGIYCAQIGRHAASLDRAIEAILHPDVVWIESEGIPYGGTFIGREAVFAGVFAEISAEWDDFTAEVDEIFSAEGRQVVTLGRDSGTYRVTDRSMEAPTASFWTLNGRCQVIRFQQYIDTLQVQSAIDIDL